jgi:hypothetical protein
MSSVDGNGANWRWSPCNMVQPININTRQYIFNILQYINKGYIIDGKNKYFLNKFTGGYIAIEMVWYGPIV